MLCPFCSKEFLLTKEKGINRVSKITRITKVGNTILYYCNSCSNFFYKRIQLLRCPICSKIMINLISNRWQCGICGRVFDTSVRPMQLLVRTEPIQLKNIKMV